MSLQQNLRRPSPPHSKATTTDDIIAEFCGATATDPEDRLQREGARRVAIVTGATSGLGLETARSLALMHWEVHVGCRNAEKGRRVVDDLVLQTGNERLFPLIVDLASMASVRAGADAFLELGRPLHLLVNNAGIASRGDDESASPTRRRGRRNRRGGGEDAAGAAEDAAEDGSDGAGAAAPGRRRRASP